MNNKIKVLITGKKGFIAKSLYEALCLKYNITSIGRDDIDLLDSEKMAYFIKKKCFDIIIHTATYDAAPKFSLKNHSLVLENNLKMFFNITRCNNYFGKMIYYGSGAEFSREHWTPKMKEEYFDEHIPTDQYGFSKYIMSKYALSTTRIYNLRLFGVFGKYDDWRYRFIPNICASAVYNKDIKIKQNAALDNLYINDLIKITEWFIFNSPEHKVFNVCSGSVYDRISLAKKLVKISGKNLKIIVDNETIKTEYSGNNHLLLNELKDYTPYNIESAIKDLYKFYLKNKTIIIESELTKYI